MNCLDEIEKALIGFVEEVAFKKVTANDELILSGILDSMSVIELISEAEQFFKIKISLTQMRVKNISNLEEMAKVILELQN
jgi:acyl carrier protein